VRESERKRAIDATTQLSSERAGGNCCGGEGASVNTGGGRVEGGDCRKILRATVLLCIIYYFVSTGGGGQATLPSGSRTACSSADRAGGPNADLARRSFISGTLYKRRRRRLDGVHGRHCVIAIILRERGRRSESDAKRRRRRVFCRNRRETPSVINRGLTLIVHKTLNCLLVPKYDNIVSLVPGINVKRHMTR